MEIVYKVYNNLYVNLTNRCSSACTFCLRQTMDKMGESDSLWLDHEPSLEEVKEAFKKFNVADFDEIVFCGFGEPTCAFERLKEVAAFVKEEYKKPVRINTNGQGNLINERDITVELKGLVDTVSISLNTPDEDRYHELVRSQFGKEAFGAMIDFAKKAKQQGINVMMTTVDTTLSKEEEERCQAICDEIGAKYRIRPWED